MFEMSCENMIEFIKALSEEKEIEQRYGYRAEWKPFDGIFKKWSPDTGNSYGWQYRIKPTPKFRPWRYNEVPVGICIRSRNDYHRGIISGVCLEDARVLIFVGNSCIDSNEVLKNWVQEDGSFCGVVDKE